MRDDSAVILDIWNAAQAIKRFKGSLSKKKFLEDELIQSGVLHQLTVIGEAVKLLSSEFKAKHTDIPWKIIAGMRDRITHGYFDIDYEVIWNTVEKDIPDLVRFIKPFTVKKK